MLEQQPAEPVSGAQTAKPACGFLLQLNAEQFDRIHISDTFFRPRSSLLVCVADLGVERALQRRVFVLVEDGSARSVLQQHLDDSLVAPAGRHVQRRVAFVVLQVQTARLDVVVDQSLHTLTHNMSAMTAQKPSGIIHLHIHYTLNYLMNFSQI